MSDVLVPSGNTRRKFFNTHQADGTPITLAGGTAKVYKDGGLTEVTTGITLTVDFDGKTGLHLVATDTSAGSGYFAIGADIAVVLTAGTVDGTSVAGAKLDQFRVVPAEASAGIPDVNMVLANDSTFSLSGTPTVSANMVSCDDGVLTDAKFGNDTTIKSMTTGTVGAAGSNSISFANGISTAADYFKGCLAHFPAGTTPGGHQTREIAASTCDGTTTTITFNRPLKGTVSNLVGSAVVIKAGDSSILPSAVFGSINDASATTSSFVGDSTLSSSNDFYNGSVIVFTSGALNGIARRITDYVGASRTFSLGNALPSAPANSVTFLVLGRID